MVKQTASYTNVVCVLKRLPKEQAGLIVRGTVVKGIIGFLGYELGMLLTCGEFGA